MISDTKYYIALYVGLFRSRRICNEYEADTKTKTTVIIILVARGVFPFIRIRGQYFAWWVWLMSM